EEQAALEHSNHPQTRKETPAEEEKREEKLEAEVKQEEQQEETGKPVKTELVVPVYAPMERETRYWMARNLIQLKRYEQALEILDSLQASTSDQPYWLRRWINLSLAQLAYHNDDETKAKGLIDRVLQADDVKDSHDKARILEKKKGNVDTFEIDFQLY